MNQKQETKPRTVDFASRLPPFKDDDTASVKTDLVDYDAAKQHPALYGRMHAKVEIDAEVERDFDPAVSHPACLGMAFVDRPPASPPPPPPSPPDKKTCSPKEYLDHYIFPVLLPAMEEMLKNAKKEKCFERKRTKFNALDFLTEYLYRNNPQQTGREDKQLLDIPFVQEWLKDHPRPPLPLSLIWTEEEAALVVQSFWKGFKIRREPGVQELRTWQREWREENENINKKVDSFWAKQMPDQVTPNASADNVQANENISVKSPASTTRSASASRPATREATVDKQDTDGQPQEQEAA